MSLLPFDFMVSSWNINGLRRVTEPVNDEKDTNILSNYIKKYKPDILFVQETKIMESEDEQKLSTCFDNYDGYFDSLSYNSAGVGVYIKNTFADELESNDITMELYTIKKDFVTANKEIFKGRIITMEFPKFYIINTYVVNSGSNLEKLEERALWDEQLSNYLQHLKKDKPLIWCGDLNVANHDIDLAHPAANKNKTAGFTDQERDSFKKMLVKSYLIDIYRHTNPNEHKYSFWSNLRKENRTKNVGWRLDYMIASRDFMELIDNENLYSDINNDVHGSDHCPVELYFYL